MIDFDDVIDSMISNSKEVKLNKYLDELLFVYGICSHDEDK